MKSRPSTGKIDPNVQVRRYLAALPRKHRRALANLRKAVRTAVPGVTDAFSYGIPGFRFDGRPLIWYAAWKAHTSLYPMSAAAREKYAAEIRNYGTSKGTIRFPIDDQPSATLVKKLTKTRLAELRARGK